LEGFKDKNVKLQADLEAPKIDSDSGMTFKQFLAGYGKQLVGAAACWYVHPHPFTFSAILLFISF
jgi:hypothetical protein